MLKPLLDFYLLYCLGGILVGWALTGLVFGYERVSNATQRAFRYLLDHPEVIDQAIRWAWQGLKRAVRTVLLVPHKLAARLALYLFRDLVVKNWPLQGSTPAQERQALIVWWLVAPAMFAAFWVLFWRALLGLWLPWPRLWLWLLAGLSTALALWYYRQQYRTQPVRHYLWPHFMVQQTLLGVALRADWALFCLHLRLSRLEASGALQLKKQYFAQRLADWWQGGDDDDG